MAIQELCDICEESWADESLVLIDRYHKRFCPSCLNDLVNDLEHKIENLQAVELAIELYNQEKVL